MTLRVCIALLQPLALAWAPRAGARGARARPLAQLGAARLHASPAEDLFGLRDRVVVVTGASSGIVQFVEDSKAISDILAENQSSILNYLRSNNPDAAAPGGVRADAVDAFTKSCAGYCVITYSRCRNGVGPRRR